MKSIVAVCSIFVVFTGVMACKDANFERLKLEALENQPKTEESPKVFDPNKEYSYKEDILPILTTYCGIGDDNCHSDVSVNVNFNNEIELYHYEGIIKPQVGSKIIVAIEHTGVFKMPYKRDKLSQVSIDIIKSWINKGMKNN